MFPVLFTIGKFNVYAFGFFLAISFIIATFIVWKFGKEELKEEEYIDGFLYSSIIALITSRFFYILLNFDVFGFNILKYVVVRETPGLYLLSGLIGAFIFLFVYSRSKKYPFLHLLDLYSIAGACALIFAKIGEQLGGAGFGRETSFILAVKIIGIPGKHHPVELYEAIFFFVLTVILLKVYKKVRAKIIPEGSISFLFGQGIVLSIFLLEFFKVRTVYFIGLSFVQIFSLSIGIVALIPFLIKFFRPSKFLRFIKKGTD